MVLFFFGVGQIIQKLDCKSMPSLLFFPSNYFHHMIQYFIRYSITNFEFANNEIDESQLEYFCVGSLKIFLCRTIVAEIITLIWKPRDTLQALIYSNYGIDAKGQQNSTIFTRKFIFKNLLRVFDPKILKLICKHHHVV